MSSLPSGWFGFDVTVGSTLNCRVLTTNRPGWCFASPTMRSCKVEEAALGVFKVHTKGVSSMIGHL